MPPSAIREAAGYFANARSLRVYGSTEVPVITVGSRGAGDTTCRRNRWQDRVADVKLVDTTATSRRRGRGAGSRPANAARLHPRPCDEVRCSTRRVFSAWATRPLIDDDYLSSPGGERYHHSQRRKYRARGDRRPLAGHPDIADVTIVGCPILATGERACAVIVRAGGRGPSADSVQAYPRRS